LLAAVAGILFLAFITAITEAVRGQYGAMGALIGAALFVGALVIAATVVVFVLSFMRKHKLLAMLLLTGGGWWLYTTLATHIPKLCNQSGGGRSRFSGRLFGIALTTQRCPGKDQSCQF
jgi:zinc transporter ZupT